MQALRNPRNLEYSVGGSSGGSGAQVAAGLVQLSIGSDNGGSVRIPSALCGVVGIKATFGRVSIDGVAPRAFSSDHVGPLGRSVDDIAIALEAMSGHVMGSATTFSRPVPSFANEMTRGVRGLKLGIDRRYCGLGDVAVLEAFGNALDRLEELGCSLREIAMPDLEEVAQVGNIIFQPEIMLWCEAMLREHGANAPPTLREDLGFAQAISAFDYLRANQRRREIQVAFARATADVDVIVSPTYFLARRPFPSNGETAVGEYPTIGNYTPQFIDALRYPLPFNFLGLPAVSVPCYIGDRGVVGLQIAGRAWNEATILSVARAYEQATDWHRYPAPSL